MSDAIKHKTPENVPFPGGLKTDSTKDEVKVVETKNSVLVNYLIIETVLYKV